MFHSHKLVKVITQNTIPTINKKITQSLKKLIVFNNSADFINIYVKKQY